MFSHVSVCSGSGRCLSLVFGSSQAAGRASNSSSSIVEQWPGVGGLFRNGTCAGSVELYCPTPSKRVAPG